MRVKNGTGEGITNLSAEASLPYMDSDRTSDVISASSEYHARVRVDRFTVYPVEGVQLSDTRNCVGLSPDCTVLVGSGIPTVLHAIPQDWSSLLCNRFKHSDLMHHRTGELRNPMGVSRNLRRFIDKARHT